MVLIFFRIKVISYGNNIFILKIIGVYIKIVDN